MPQPSQESTQPVSLQPNSHSSKWSTTQIEPRAVAAAEALAAQEATRPLIQTSSLPNSGSTTQIEPRVAAFEAALAIEREREARGDSGAPTIDKIIALLTDALPSVPDARLVVTSSCYPKDANKNSSIIRLPQKVRNRVTFGVLQQTQDVDLIMHLPLQSHSPPIEVECQIIYDPGSDDCLLVNYTKPELQLINFSSSLPTRVHVKENSSHLLQPGMWRISAGGNEGGPDECHLAEFWLLRRQFSISIHKAKHPPQAKRTADTDADTGAIASKRQKLDNNLAKTDIDLTKLIATRSANISAVIESGPAATHTKSTDNNHLVSPSSAREIVNKSAVPILDLADGETAIIQALQVSSIISQSTSKAKGLARYQLQRIKYVGATRSTSVFTCQHSAIPELVVAKVLRHDRETPYNFTRFSSLWKQEKNILERLKHRNIVSLKAFDGRMFALYLEPLPQSLLRGLKSTLQLTDAYTILHNISSALSYLTTLPIIHNDIKPLNITYSPHRGAVLIDFGMATATDGERAGGSPWYLPPDFIEKKKIRGSPGDIWALGITMLYVLGKIDFPERSVKGWTIHDLYRAGDSRTRMINWLDFISGIRVELNHVPDKGDIRGEIEHIVFKMLEGSGTLRIKAENITSALDEMDSVGHVADSAEDGGSSIQPQRR